MEKLDFSNLYVEDFQDNYFGVMGVQYNIPTRKFICKKGERKHSRLFYITGGTFSIKPKGEEEIIATKGDFLYLPSDCEYTSKWCDVDRGFFSINFVLNDHKKEILFSDKICLIKKDNDGVYYSYFEEINNIWIKALPGYKIHCKAKFYEMLYLLLSESIKEHHKNIEKGIMYLESHYTEDIPIDYIAKLCNVSPSSFRRLFKEYSSLPPVQYRNMLRIKKAQELLRTGEYSVLEVAEAVNIPDVCYFSKLFKKITGQTPLNFKLSN